MTPTDVPVEDFLETVTVPARLEDARVLIALMSSLTGEDAVMWGPSIIGFGVSHLRYASGRRVDVPLLGFSPRKSALSIYLTEGFAESGDLLARLGRHRAAKSCLYVTRLSDVDMSVLEELLVRTRDVARAMDTGAQD